MLKWLSMLFARLKKKLVPQFTDRNLVDVAGMSIVASAGAEKGPRTVSDDFFGVKEASEARRMYNCGHDGPVWFVLKTYDMETKKLKGKPKCPDCALQEIKHISCRCALCRGLILPGEPVALYHKSSQGLHRDIATFVEDNVIGCMGWNCCPSGGFFAGHWMGPEGFQSAFEHGSAAAEAMATGKPVFRNI